MNNWSKWLDYWLQQLKDQILTFVKDSQKILYETSSLQPPPNLLLFRADANLMYIILMPITPSK